MQNVLDLTAEFERMQAASRSEPAPTLVERKARLKALRAVILDHKGELAAAISKDFGTRSRRETLLAEVLPTLQAIDDALRHLGRWMAPERRRVALHFLPASNRVIRQPKGVVLIIAPWNYPLQLATMPLVAALAAGNRVVIKPSELTPSFSEVLKRRLEAALGADWVLVVPGGVEVATALTALPFDHLLFTGSTAVGAKVMAAAAKNLTPVTLELGGKSPAIVHEAFDVDLAATRIMRGKLLNAGQTCIAPDYVLAPEARLDDVVAACRRAAERLYPRLVANPDYTSIVSAAHYERLTGLLADARAKGATVISIDPAREVASGESGSANTRKLLPALITGLRDEMRICQEEIFGPLLPVVGYHTLDDAVRYVNARPRPLALYCFDTDRARIREVLARTVSGGVAVNDTILHVAQDDLPFGGVGPSGLGAYHGEEGFRTFSHAKAVFRQSRLAATDLLAPPYGRRFDTIVNGLVTWLGGFGRGSARR